MKTILVDAWNTFVTNEGIHKDMQQLLDSYINPKVILTNANAEEMISFGIVNMPYPVFSLAHDPNKPNPAYFQKMLDHFELSSNEVVYFEHHEDAVNSARSLYIETLWFQNGSSLNTLKQFLDQNL